MNTVSPTATRIAPGSSGSPPGAEQQVLGPPPQQRAADQRDDRAQDPAGAERLLDRPLEQQGGDPDAQPGEPAPGSEPGCGLRQVPGALTGRLQGAAAGGCGQHRDHDAHGSGARDGRGVAGGVHRAHLVQRGARQPQGRGDRRDQLVVHPVGGECPDDEDGGDRAEEGLCRQPGGTVEQTDACELFEDPAQERGVLAHPARHGEAALPGTRSGHGDGSFRDRHLSAAVALYQKDGAAADLRHSGKRPCPPFGHGVDVPPGRPGVPP